MIRLAMLAEHSDDEHSVDGGVQAVTKYLVDELAKSAQLDVHVLSFKYGTNRIESWESHGYTRHQIPATRLGAFSVYKRDQRRMNAYLGRLRPDIVHSQGAGHYGIVATRCPFPALVTIHGIMSEEAKHAAGLRLKFRRWFISMLSDRYCIRGNKSTILISPYVADHYGNRLAGPQIHIPNPVAPSFFAVKRSERPGRILFAGRLLPLKGLGDLLAATAAVASTRNVELILAGSLDNHRYVNKLRAKAEELNIRESVQFRGILDETELLDEFAKASLLVLPSYQETAPMVIQEAMAAGLPVVATRVGGIPYQIDHGKSGLIVEPGDVRSLTESLTCILNDSELRKSFAIAARRRAENLYRADKVAEQTEKAYERVLELRETQRSGEQFPSS